MLNKLVSLAAVALLVLGSAAARADKLAEILSKGVVRIIVFADVPPFSSANVQRELEVVLTSLNSGADIMRMEDNATSVQAYLSGQSQLLAANSVVVVELAKKNPTKEFDFKFALRRAPAHITVKLGEHNLLRWLDTFIFQATLTGDLDKLHAKWLGGPMTAPLPPL